MSLTVFAAIGPEALYLVLVWLASAIAASWLSGRAGYGETAGLATGLVLSALAVVIWLLMYVVAARAGSPRRVEGIVPRRHAHEPVDINAPGRTWAAPTERR